MATTPSPFVDPAAPILAGDPALDDQQRSDLWDAFHTKSPEELIAHLQPLAIPDDTKQRLLDERKKMIAPPAPVDQVSAALDRVAQLDPKTLEIAESHPNVTKLFVSAATTPAKEAGEPSGKAGASSKGKAAGKTPKPPEVTPDLPPAPPGHALVQASDGGMYHVPVENIDRARQIDPALKILHVQPAEEAQPEA